MILLDTNIIGTFAVIGELELLVALFGREEIGIVPAVHTEILQGLRDGRGFLQAADDLLRTGTLTLIPLSADEVLARGDLPGSLDAGEAESIAVCQSRGAAFATNDRRARNLCLSVNIEVFDLVDILGGLWRLGLCLKQKVRRLISEIEAKEGTVIKRKDGIFGE